METLAWLVVVAPLAAFVAIFAFSYRNSLASAMVAMVGTAVSLAVSIALLLQVMGGGRLDAGFSWLRLGDVNLELGVLVDPMASLMFVVVSFIALLVEIYSLGYMHGDPGFSRYYGFLSLFTFSMLGLVAANNLVQLFIFWELVGLCSYLLIGFWYDQPGVALSPPLAGMRAFITTRIGDVGFLLGILVLSTAVPSFSFNSIFHAVEAGKVDAALVTTAAILLFAGAVGKSAQFPLHTWLPDAMEGPTPVSALIHAATMVAAGVYMVARLMPLFEVSSVALAVVAYTGGFTAILAASIALATTDFKRVIGYSTISQLGYMMMALGVSGAATAGMFHLTTHAFFKALLFLAIGSVIHGAGSQEMRDLGGLGKDMKTTSFAFLMGALALSGVPPFAGFWSKDEIITTAVASGNIGLAVVGLIAAFMTAFYIFRVYFHTFSGERPRHMKKHHVHEAPFSMRLPMVVLAVLAVVAGLMGTPWNNYFAGFLGAGEHSAEGGGPAVGLMVLSTLIALAAIGLAWLVYGRRRVQQDPMARSVPALYSILHNKYYIENFYYGVIVRYGALGLASLAALFDRAVIDGIVNGVAWLVAAFSGLLRRVQSGYLQHYVLTAFTTVVIAVIYFMLFFKV